MRKCKNMLAYSLLLSVMLSGCGRDSFTPDVEVVSRVSTYESSSLSISNADTSSIDTVSVATVDNVVICEDSDRVEINKESMVSKNESKTGKVTSSSVEENSNSDSSALEIGEEGRYYLNSGNDRVSVGCKILSVASSEDDSKYISDILSDYNTMRSLDDAILMTSDYNYYVIDLEFKLYSVENGKLPIYKGVPYADISLFFENEGNNDYKIYTFDRDYSTHASGEEIKGWLIILVDAKYKKGITLSMKTKEGIIFYSIR